MLTMEQKRRGRRDANSGGGQKIALFGRGNGDDRRRRRNETNGQNGCCCSCLFRDVDRQKGFLKAGRAVGVLRSM